jgi:hypothetical protein
MFRLVLLNKFVIFVYRWTMKSEGDPCFSLMLRGWCLCYPVFFGYLVTYFLDDDVGNLLLWAIVSVFCHSCWTADSMMGKVVILSM